MNSDILELLARLREADERLDEVYDNLSEVAQVVVALHIFCDQTKDALDLAHQAAMKNK